ncbi:MULTISPECIES: fimbrial protein [unclassified Paraburkholderia]|uniref:fimbrial protein n=1 Tax=unclassified Paraburkholderia TaxID=2615204 RepID=UPI00161C7EBC|nr:MULTISPECIES: fimbrial protein [unclassified Paraburkholderia]MBB5445118.1 major type 1 subunit fimbrin (pilin) [Paraburkholderia sp. WSM4177]MBB5485666.1 major type 1 subunit fimbrin (pilin) [Paraburkholderia sp. WSM4180]
MNGRIEWVATRILSVRSLVRILFAVAFCMSAQSAWALRCLTSSGQDSFTESIGSVQTYPENAPDGTIIWISPTRTTTGYCYKDIGGSALTHTDPIYFYPNPKNVSLSGVEIGIRYQGRDYYGQTSQAGQGVPTGYVVPRCANTTFSSAQGCPRLPVSITYQVIVRKQGAWVGTLPNTYAAFQFDGLNGINCCATSFAYILSGLSALAPTPCTVDVTVTPEPGIVDFGQVQATPTGFSPVRPTRPFSLLLQKKQCDTGVNIQGYFQTSNPVQNNLILPEADSNFGIGVQDGNGNQVPIGEPFNLQTFGATQTQVSLPFTATLTPLGEPKIGPFTATATVLILYD